MVELSVLLLMHFIVVDKWIMCWGTFVWISLYRTLDKYWIILFITTFSFMSKACDFLRLYTFTLTYAHILFNPSIPNWSFFLVLPEKNKDWMWGPSYSVRQLSQNPKISLGNLTHKNRGLFICIICAVIGKHKCEHWPRWLLAG